MCKAIIPNIKYICGDKLKDAPVTLIPWDGCGGCGVQKAGPEHLAQTTKRVPCEDCIQNGSWKKDPTGKWVRNA
jgi:hypothetical protein